MVSVESDDEVSEGPRQINPDNVMYWSKHYKEIVGNFKKKSLRFLNLDCIKYVGDDEEFKSKYTFLVLPLNKATEIDFEGRIFTKKPHLVDYNSSIYKIYKNNQGRFSCTCQAWTTKEKRNEGRDDGCQCSHTLALFLAFKCNFFKNKGG